MLAMVREPGRTVDVPTTMKAAVHERYGPPGTLEVRDVDVPGISDDEVLVRVCASSVNPVEWYGVRGPFFARVGGGLRRPKSPAIGADLAGRVEAVGPAVRDLQPGDEVFGSSDWSWAEYAAVDADRLVRKPARVSFEAAAAVPVAGRTALQAIRDHADVQPGQKVLINGAAGGVGTFAVQIAKAYGAEVTGVCSTTNVEQTRSLGAEHVIDYTREDFTRSRERYDAMIDIAGSRSFLAFRRVLKPDATVVTVGAPMSTKGLGPITHLVASRLLSIGRSQTVKLFITKRKREDLAILSEMLEAGTVKAVIDRRYPLSRVADALQYLETRHARGKIVVTV